MRQKWIKDFDDIFYMNHRFIDSWRCVGKTDNDVDICWFYIYGHAHIIDQVIGEIRSSKPSTYFGVKLLKSFDFLSI